MCVPVKSRSSRIISTRSMRGSTASSYDFPLTFTLMGTRCTSGIDVTDLHALTTGTPGSDIDGTLEQPCNQRPLVLGGATHVRLRIGGQARSIGSLGNRVWADGMTPQLTFRTRRPHRRKPDAAKVDGSVAALAIFHAELNRYSG